MAEPQLSPVPPSRQPLSGESVREVVGLFGDTSAVGHAVQDLLTHGFDRAEITVLGSEHALGRLSLTVADAAAAADDPHMPRRGWMEPESRMEGRGALASMLGYLGAVAAAGVTFATGGAAGAAVGAALVGAGSGAALGAGLGRLFESRLANEFERQIKAGGILLWVRSRDGECERRAAEVLRAHGGGSIHTHTID